MGMQNKSIRTQMIVYLGGFVILPLCLALMILNVYLQRTISDNKINQQQILMKQIKDNAEQMIEVSNYVSSMMMINQEVLEGLHILENEEDSYNVYKAREDISMKISELESSTLNAVGGKLAVLTNSGYLIGSHNLSKTAVKYQDTDWYQQIIENGRTPTYSTKIAQFFEEMNHIKERPYQALYFGRSIRDYSGKCLGVIFVRLSDDKIWGGFIQSLYEDEKSTLYIYNAEDQTQLIYNQQENNADDLMKQILTDEEINRGTTAEGLHYFTLKMKSSDNFLIYTAPKNIVFAENDLINNRILQMILLLVLLTCVILIYLSKRLSDPIRCVARQIENSENAIDTIHLSKHTFLEINTFIQSYNKATGRILELIEKVKEESRLKEKAHYEMLMSQISPHFVFNTVNTVRIMAKEHGETETEQALTALGEILHAVYANQNGMTTVGREVAIVASYVQIMQIRFGKTFQYYDVLPSDLYFYEIPAFTLQPILENAILHGVSGVQGGQIILSAVEYEYDFVISVFNNGNSAEREAMEQILKSPVRNKSNFTGIGLSNVNARLKMLYGDQYGLIFNEKVQNGFEMWIRVPKRREGGERK